MRRVLDTFYAALMGGAAFALAAAFACVMLGIADRQIGWGLLGLAAGLIAPFALLFMLLAG